MSLRIKIAGILLTGIAVYVATILVLQRTVFESTLVAGGEGAAAGSGFSWGLVLLTWSLAGLVVWIALLLLLTYIAVKPIRKLADHIESLENDWDVPSPISKRRRDEIGRLAAELDRMTDRMMIKGEWYDRPSDRRASSEAILDLQRPTGGVPGTLSTELEAVLTSLKKIPLDKVERAHRELAGGAADEERKEALVEFLLLASRRLSKLVQETCAQLEALTAELGHTQTTSPRQEE